VWVGLCGTPSLVRIDPATGDVQATIPLPVTALHEESSVAAGEAGVFLVAGPDNQIVNVDPSTNTVAEVFDVPPGATAVRAGFGSLWVSYNPLDVVMRLDPATGEVIASIDVGDGPRFLAVGADGVWVMNQAGGSLSRIDPTTDTVVATVRVNEGPIDGGDITVGGGSVWTRISDHLLARVVESSNQVTQFYDPASGSGGVAADDNAVWLSAHDINSMWRLPLN
jgi:YVTN family beta-propeller protein